MKKGYVTGHYGKGEDRYRPLGVDPHGQIYFPVSPDLAPVHHYVAGHPVTAEGDGAQEAFIQVTQISGGTFMKDRKSQPSNSSRHSPSAVTRTQPPGFSANGTGTVPATLNSKTGSKTIQPFRWHISINNPTDKEITATLTKNMKLPGLDFPEQNITLKPGEYQVLVD